MMKQTLLNVSAVFVLLAPVNIISYFTDDSIDQEANAELKQTNEENGPIREWIDALWGIHSMENSTEDKTVTTSETTRVAAAEPEKTAEEEQREAFENWLSELPAYEDGSYQAEFIQTIAPAAVMIANQHDIYPSVMIAQASLESSWGQSGLAQDYNNLMGTKGSWNGESVTVRTREDVNGESVYINAGFSVYDSWTDSLYRYGLLLANGLESDPDFYSGTWRRNTDSYKDATAWLQGRYATDRAYADKLNATIQSFNLDQFDEVEPFDLDVDDVIDEISI